MDNLVIAQPDDWRRIGEAGLRLVVDPMVFRSADVFLRGWRGAPKPDDAWLAIGSNIGSLCTFFDALILEKCLPMYDYGSTFPPDLQTGKHTLVEWCNDRGPTLLPVQVRGAAYDEVKREALAALAGQPEAAPDLARDNLKETSAFDWEWRPDLWPGGWRGRPEGADVLAAFRFGGLLFGGYAQRTGCDHLLQPKRARLFLADRLRVKRADDEALLFGPLTQLAGQGSRAADWPASPTFLPLLLAQDYASPRALLQHALRLRARRRWPTTASGDARRCANSPPKAASRRRSNASWRRSRPQCRAVWRRRRRTWASSRPRSAPSWPRWGRNSAPNWATKSGMPSWLTGSPPGSIAERRSRLAARCFLIVSFEKLHHDRRATTLGWLALADSITSL
jgi:hypothetical protein